MMRLYQSVFVISMILLISGCVSTTKYEEVVKNLDQSSETISKLENDLNAANKKLEKIEVELTELKNGADITIIEVRKQYENNNYDKVLELAEVLHEKFNGVPEDIEAQALVKQIQEIKEQEAKKINEEMERQLAEESKSAQDKARSVLRVSKIYPSKPNSAGGVDLYILWKNNSDSVIKYARFEVVPYNAVDDVVTSEISGISTFYGRETGPFKKGQGSSSDTYWENAWYNSTIKKVKLISVNIEYMDGTELTLKDDDVKYIQY
ncbi:MAG: hypothetical protein P0Y55_00325 [Candidatus Cohnella colombiensis]|uniref:Uncharacterized protein n=1 Tax=Candidatus Cohnella colombiensis TaxID=3121368 RepID=A0AA95JD36_9BACL|nr:MAG: hypothetical protein P0Y55_00325 [Cohnella sp.]